MEETLEPIALRDSIEDADPSALDDERVTLLAAELREAIRRKLPAPE